MCSSLGSQIVYTASGIITPVGDRPVPPTGVMIPDVLYTI